MSPKELTQLVKGKNLTDVYADLVLEPHIHKWITVTAPTAKISKTYSFAAHLQVRLTCDDVSVVTFVSGLKMRQFAPLFRRHDSYYRWTASRN